MSTLLIICTILIIIGIILFVIDIITDELGAYFATGLIIILSTAILGFGLFACSLNHSHKVEQVLIDTLVKSPTTVYVELVNNEHLEFTSKQDYDYLNMDTKIYKVTYFNHYNYELNTEYVLDTTKIE